MRVTDTYVTKDKEKRLMRQAELHRLCILILQASKAKERGVV